MSGAEREIKVIMKRFFYLLFTFVFILIVSCSFERQENIGGKEDGKKKNEVIEFQKDLEKFKKELERVKQKIHAENKQVTTPTSTATTAALLAQAPTAGKSEESGSAKIEPSEPMKKNEEMKDKGKSEKRISPQEILKQLEKEKMIKEEERTTVAEGYYRIAKEFYQRRKLEMAKKNLYKALEYAPGFVAAKELLEQVKLELGEEVKGEIGGLARSEFDRMSARIQSAKLEIENLFRNAVSNFEKENYSEAQKQFEKALEAMKWFPYELSLDYLKKQIIDYLEKTKKLKEKKELSEKRKLEEAAKKLAVMEEIKRKVQKKKDVNKLFTQAIKEYKRGNLELSLEILKQILEIEPRHKDALQLKDHIKKKLTDKEKKEIFEKSVEESKRQEVVLKSKEILQTDIIKFPEKKIWDKIKKRKVVTELLETSKPSEKERRIMQILETTFIPPEISHVAADTTLNLVLSTLRKLIKDIDFNYIGADLPDKITLPNGFPEVNTEISVKYWLDKLLSDNSTENLKLKYKATDQGIVIYKQGDQIFTVDYPVVFYDVSDIVKPIKSFVPPDTAPGKVGDKYETSPPLPVVTIEELVQMICTFVPIVNENGEVVEDYQKPSATSFESPKNGCATSAINSNNFLVNAMPNNIISVKQPMEIQEEVKKLLDEVRKTLDVQVAIEVRFMFTTDTFLRDIGLDLRGLEANSPLSAEAYEKLYAGGKGLLMGAFNADLFPYFTKDIYAAAPTTQGATVAPPTTKTQYPSAGFAQGQDLRGRLENLMGEDVIIRSFFRESMEPKGGLTLQYTLLGKTMLEAILRAVNRDQRIKQLRAQKIIAYNGQRVNLSVETKMSYVKRYEIRQGFAGTQDQAPFPADIDSVSQGIFFDVRPIVSYDRKYITLELRPAFSTLFPPPPNINSIPVAYQPQRVQQPGAQQQQQVPQEPPRIEVETPIVDTRIEKTTAVIPDGGSVLIGGFTVTNQVDGVSEVPILANVPIIGKLFRRKIKGTDNRLLVIIVSASIIIPSEVEKKSF